jgi:5-methyltetrahydrofolate--homocysteine methyltransferase
MVDCPEGVDRAMQQVRALYAPVYEAVYEAGDMRRGCTSWLPSYCEQRYAVVECDVICLMGPRHARRFVLPALAEETAYLEHCIYHFDGPTALPHLDDILALPHIDAIQWVPGDGQPRSVEWMELLRKIQAAGKGLWLDWTIDEIHQHYQDLRPEGLCFYLTPESPQQVDELLDWLKRHT